MGVPAVLICAGSTCKLLVLKVLFPLLSSLLRLYNCGQILFSSI